ncbi:MAG: hypothetical protein ABR554_09770, partial [Pyrinomonadaceae bacterium]
MRNITLAIVAVCSCAAAASAQHGRLPPSTTPPQPARTPARDEAPPPTMKKSERVDAAPSHARRSYDAAHDTTYLSVDIPLVSHTLRKLPSGALAFEGRDVTLTFQLAYRGKRTEDLRAAYVVLESTAAPPSTGADAGDRLSAANRLELRADAYEYAYERTEYKNGTATQTGAAQKNAPPLKREIALFRIETEDLASISSANRLELKLGAETFTVKSPQLSELRRTLANGD